MAVIVRDFSWMQTKEQVVVRVPMRGVHPSTVNLFTYDSYIKASFKPFLFEVFLLHSISEPSSNALIAGDEIVFNLEKEEKGLEWETLSANLTKEEKIRAREQAIQEVHNRAKNEKIKKQELQQTQHRKAVQQQIDMETKEKRKIEELKNLERDKAMSDLESWRANSTKTEELTACKRSTERGGLSARNNSTTSSSTSDNTKTEGDCSEMSSSLNDDQNIRSVTHEANPRILTVQLNEEDLRPVPFPRTCGSIKVKFTPRAFPTPQRESKSAEEKEWLQKQAEARRATGFVAEDLRPEECNPQWLKDKGEVGNYLGAVSAYSHGIKFSEKMVGLYVNRSAAHFALGNLKRVIEDTSTALDLMVPKVKLNEESRARCHARRGAALFKLGMLQSALADLEAALLLHPHDYKLQSDIRAMKMQLCNLESKSSEDE